jgi:pyridoxal phosphate enzyme (YggS family)
MTTDTIAGRVAAVRGRIGAAAERAGRAPDETVLCAVTKTFPVEAVQAVVAAGVSVIGENRVQEAVSKKPSAPVAEWHLIGHLQSNKVRRAVDVFDCIQTVDGVRLAERLVRAAGEAGRQLAVYVQVDLGREPTKTGALERDVEAIASFLARAPEVRLAGLMTVPPYFADPEDVRPFFRRLRALRDRLNASDRLPEPIAGLSMGMSHDFEVAVEEGATLVRVGSALFGDRTAP